MLNRVLSSRLFYPAVLALLTLAVFFKPLFLNTDLVLSGLFNDIFGYFIYTLQFGFDQLRQGNLALWNPFLFCGTPFLGNFQSMLLYPPNVFFLLLPVHNAVNISIAVHVFLFALFVYLWCRRQMLHPAACFTAAAAALFSGPYFLRIFGGHLAILYVLTWVPLLFLSIDGCSEEGYWPWFFTGTLSVVMQLLGGNPQYLLYTALIAGTYSLVIAIKEKYLWLLAFLPAVYAAAAIIGAAQLVAGFSFASESLRGGGLPYTQAAVFSFAPENIVTTLVPGFFGNDLSFPYWGRNYLWEMTSFAGTGTFLFALYYVLFGERKCILLPLALLLLSAALALGKHLPLFGTAYRLVPFLDSFRCPARFMFFAVLFMVILTAQGIDLFLRTDAPHRKTYAVILLGTTLLMLLALAAAEFLPFWRGTLDSIPLLVHWTKETILDGNSYRDPMFLAASGRHAASGILRSAMAFSLFSALFYLSTRTSRVKPLLLAVLVGELLFFAVPYTVAFNRAATLSPDLKRFAATVPDDRRSFVYGNPNLPLSVPAPNIYGYDATVLRRYAEFIIASQDLPYDTPWEAVRIRRPGRLFALLRCGPIAAVSWPGNPRSPEASVPEDFQLITELKRPMHRLNIMHKWKVMPDRDKLFTALKDDDFDFRTTVLIERDPGLAADGATPDAGGEYAVVLDSSTDHMTVEARLNSAGILLITDSFSNGWHAAALAGDRRKSYTIMPGDHALMAVPLEKGSHLFRIEYRPRWFREAAAVSLAGLVVFAGGGTAWFFRMRRKRETKKDRP